MSRRWWVAVGVVVLALVVTIASAGAWYFSGQINHDMLDATNAPITYDLTAIPVGADAVRVTAPDRKSTRLNSSHLRTITSSRMASSA
jgi:hypothetical protein